MHFPGNQFDRLAVDRELAVARGKLMGFSVAGNRRSARLHCRKDEEHAEKQPDLNRSRYCGNSHDRWIIVWKITDASPQEVN